MHEKLQVRTSFFLKKRPLQSAFNQSNQLHEKLKKVWRPLKVVKLFFQRRISDDAIKFFNLL